MGDPTKAKPGGTDAANKSRFYHKGYDAECKPTARGAAACTPSAAEQVQAELDADPVAGGHTIIATGNDEASIRAAMSHLNDVRHTKGMAPISKADIDTVVADVNKGKQAEGNNPFSLVHMREFRIAVVPPGFSAPDSISDYLVQPANDKFKKSLSASYGEQGAILHETAHLLSSHAILKDWDMKERVADMTMSLARIARHEDGMLHKIADFATRRALQPGREHSQSADDLMRLRHELITDPKKLHAEIDGKSLPELVKIAEKKILAQDAAYTPQGMEGSYNGMQIAIALLVPQPGRAPTQPIDRDAAITLLRTQIAVEHSTVPGKDNGLTRAMPALWRDNAKAFGDAQKYMHDQYGVTVHQPPVPKPVKRSVLEQSLGM